MEQIAPSRAYNSGRQVAPRPSSNIHKAWDSLCKHQRSVRVAILLALIIALNFCDLLYTLFAHQQGLLDEQNPIARHLDIWQANVGIVGFKTILVAVAVYLLWRVRRNTFALVACWLMLAVYVALSLLWVEWVHHYLVAMHYGQAIAMR